MKFFQSNREKYYDLFEELADKLVEGIKLFTEILDNYEYSEFKVGKLKEIEHEADHITHQVYKRMHKMFLTPMDREDIFPERVLTGPSQRSRRSFSVRKQDAPVILQLCGDQHAREWRISFSGRR
jgi:hypothetical protein